MKGLGSIAILLGGAIAVLSGVESVVAHYVAGDLLAQSCSASEAAAWSGQCPSYLLKSLGQIGAGFGVLSPGLASLKTGLLARAPIKEQIATQAVEAKAETAKSA